jgi:hypothetical protein
MFVAPLMLVPGLSPASVGWWFGRRDIEYIPGRVREALLSGGA